VLSDYGDWRGSAIEITVFEWITTFTIQSLTSVSCHYLYISQREYMTHDLRLSIQKDHDWFIIA